MPVAITIEGVISLAEGLMGEVPAAIAAFNSIKAAFAQQGSITQAQWDDAQAQIDAANNELQAAQPPSV